MSGESLLKELKFWPETALQRLAKSWIVSAEQIVAIAATADGLRLLAQETGLEYHEIEELVEKTKRVLAPSTLESMDKPADTRSFGRGALKPKE